MIQQSSALRTLEEVLTKAIAQGDIRHASGPILLEAMALENQPRNIIYFYELLNKAEDEARSIRARRNIDRYVPVVEALRENCVIYHLWSVAWETLAAYINTGNVLNTLDALAEYFYLENPTIFLEKDFLENLDSEFTSLLKEVLKSDLSKKFKILLIRQVEDILRAIRRYQIDGTEGLKKAAQSLVGDLVMAECNLQDVEKKKPVYVRIKTCVFAFLLYITPTPYDAIGAVADINDFWIPKFEELSRGHEKIEKIICEAPTIQEAFERSSDVFDRKAQKSIEGGKELKALPPSK